jgi:hypothetical protein
MHGLQGKTRYLGTFDDRVVAAKCHDRAALEAHGARAELNFPPGSITGPTPPGAQRQQHVVSDAEGCGQEGPATNGSLPAGSAASNPMLPVPDTLMNAPEDGAPEVSLTRHVEFPSAPSNRPTRVGDQDMYRVRPSCVWHLVFISFQILNLEGSLDCLVQTWVVTLILQPQCAGEHVALIEGQSRYLLIH